MSPESKLNKQQLAELIASRSLKDFEVVSVAKEFGVDPLDVKAISIVESSGSGFYTTQGVWQAQLKVRLEGHKFRKYTKGKYDRSHPNLSYPYTRNDRNVKVGQAEFGRFITAAQLDVQSAQLASSWGMFQTMGFNHESCGYDSAADMINDYYIGEVKQLRGFFNYCNYHNLIRHIKSGNYDNFFAGYNGKDWKGQDYDTKFFAAREKYKLTFKQFDPCL